ncbi:MAG: phosphoribosylglycinamide formyltransferase [Helicobacter sp.]|nr:phosphoribosylglycinamide formyltransferase [Helicobacter sp.]
MRDFPLVIFFSGNGSNMQNLYEQLHHKEFMGLRLCVCAVLCNNENAYGITRAKALDVPCLVVPHRHKTRHAFETQILQALAPFAPKLCILAGFMRILSPHFLQHYPAINIHPSLLPLFKGAHAIKESFESDMKIAGVSVHWVSAELDSGAIIDQAAFHRKETPTFESFEQKIHALEYALYPRAVLQALQQSFLKADME